MSTNLSLPDLTESQVDKMVTFNSDVDQLDALQSEVYEILVDDSNAASVPANLRATIIKISPDSPAPGGAITITFPAEDRGFFVLFNNTAQTVTPTVTGQSPSPPTVTTGKTRLLVNNTKIRPAGEEV